MRVDGQWTSSNLATFKRKGAYVSADTVERVTSGSSYRSDLSRFALARYNALNKSLSVKNHGVIKQRTRRGAKKN